LRYLQQAISDIFSETGESLDDCFARFESTISSLRSCGPLAYSDNERAKQLFYVLDDHVWGMKISALKESSDFVTLKNCLASSNLMNCLESIILIMMLLMLVRLLLLVLLLVAMMLTPPTPLSHLLWSLPCPL
jgi:hypothetical protein